MTSIDSTVDPLGFFKAIQKIVQADGDRSYRRGCNVDYNEFPGLVKLFTDPPDVTHGQVSLTKQPKIFIDLGGTRAICINNPGRMTQDNINDLITAGSPAPFGQGTETVLDPKVRKAIEIPADKIILSSDLFDDDTVYTALELENDVKVSVKLYKMHIYPEGGHFEEHLDTLHSENHVATIVVGLGCDYTGGELEIDGIKYDLHPIVDDHSSNSMQCVVFYTDLRHKVHPVTSGTRVVLQYDVFFKPTQSKLNDEDDDCDDPYERDRRLEEDFRDYESEESEQSDKESEDHEESEDSEEPEQSEDREEPDKDIIKPEESEYLKESEQSDKESKDLEESKTQESKDREAPKPVKSYAPFISEIRRVLDDLDGRGLGIFCNHMYPLGALNNLNGSSLLKGSDRVMHAILSEHFHVGLQGLMIYKTRTGGYDGGEFKLNIYTVDMTDIVRTTISPVEPIEHVEQCAKRQRIDTEDNKCKNFVLSWDHSRAPGMVISESPYIEHTGNESQWGHLLYHSVCFVISSKV